MALGQEKLLYIYGRDWVAEQRNKVCLNGMGGPDLEHYCGLSWKHAHVIVERLPTVSRIGRNRVLDLVSVHWPAFGQLALVT